METMSTPLSVLGPEARTLLAAVPAGMGLEGPDIRTSSGLRPPAPESLDWAALYRLIVRERAAAALHPIPERLPVDPPAEWDERLRALGAVAGFRQRRLLDSLEDVVEVLADRGIRICLLKGAALALTRYPDPLQRPMGDLDLLVEGGRAGDAWKILREEGWVWDRDRYPLDLYDPRQHRPPLEAPGRDGRFVEIHEGLLIDGHPFGLGPADLMADAGSVAVGTAKAGVPASVGHLVYTCIHFAWSDTLSSGGWRTFRDVAALAADPVFDWEDVLRRARRWGAERPCYWTLRLASRLGGVRVPDPVLSSLRPSALPSSALGALERHYALGLFAGREDAAGCPSVTLNRILWRVGVQPSGPGVRAAVPWEHDEGFRRLQAARGEEPASPPGPLRRLARHLAGAGAWARYLGSVVGRDAMEET